MLQEPRQHVADPAQASAAQAPRGQMTEEQATKEAETRANLEQATDEAEAQATRELAPYQARRIQRSRSASCSVVTAAPAGRGSAPLLWWN